MKIRHASLELNDNNKLDAVLQSWEETSNIEEFGMKGNIETFRAEFCALIMNPNTTLLVLENDGGHIVGVFGVVIFENPISGQKAANEHYWYTLPEYRGRGGYMLLKEAKKWAVEQGCSHFMASASMMASDLHDKVCDLYARIGMRKFETTYIKQLNGG